MSITSLLDLRIKPGVLDDAHEMLRSILFDTRAFPGCQGVDVLVDVADPTHLILKESWESIDADTAYRAWRAGEGATELGTVLTAAPALTVLSLESGI